MSGHWYFSLLWQTAYVKSVFNRIMKFSSIKLWTLNVRGIYHSVKRRKILASLKKEGVEIATLQETYLRDQEHHSLTQVVLHAILVPNFLFKQLPAVSCVRVPIAAGCDGHCLDLINVQ